MHRLVKILCVLTTAVSTVVMPSAASAGEYTVVYGSVGIPLTNGPWRSSTNASPPWQISATQIYAPPGSYVMGAYAQYQYYVPNGLTMFRFCAWGTATTPNDFLYFTIDANNTTPYLSKFDTGDYAFCTPAPPNNESFTAGQHLDLAMKFNKSTSIDSTINRVTFREVRTYIRDSSNPAITAVSAPSGWIGPNTCNRMSWTVTDSGSGAWSSQLLRDGAVEHAWNRNVAVTGPQPGAASQPVSVCLASPASTGVHAYALTASDYSGNAISTTIATQLWDLTSPNVDTQVADGSRYSTYQPAFAFSASDGDSGIASHQAAIDGAPVASSLVDGVVTFTPPSELSLGTHTISVVVTDRVGNSSTASRGIQIVDTTLPTLSLTSPTSDTHGNSPVLDVMAADDKSGIDPASWAVTVNGQPLAVASSNDRLQAAVGRLVNGTHTITVHVADNAGNGLDTTISYLVTSEAVTPPGLDGLYLLTSPALAYARQTYSVTAIAARHGRPVGAGRFEISAGTVVIAGKDASPDGFVDMLVKIDGAGPLQLSLAGSGLAPVAINYTYNDVGTAPWCQLYYPDPACDANWGTSGIAGLDHVKPRATLALIVRRNVIRRGLDFTLRANERATATLTLPKDVKRTAILTPGRVTHVRVSLANGYATRLGLRRGRCIRLPVVVTAKDRAGNTTRAARYVFPICG